MLNKLLHFSALLSTHSLEKEWSLGFRGRGIGKIISFFLLIKSKLITRANTRQKLLLHCLMCLFVSCFLLFFFGLRVSFHSFDICMKEVVCVCVLVKGNDDRRICVACFVGICCRG